MKGSCAGVVVLAGTTGRVLLLLRPEGVWENPGGHLERGETHRAAGFREMREETGHDGPIQLSQDGVQTGVGGRDYVSFVAIVPAEFQPVTPEHVGWAWYDPSGHPPGNLHPGAAKAIAWASGALA